MIIRQILNWYAEGIYSMKKETCPLQSHGWWNVTYSFSLLYIPMASFVASPSSVSVNFKFAVLSNNFAKCRQTYKIVKIK